MFEFVLYKDVYTLIGENCLKRPSVMAIVLSERWQSIDAILDLLSHYRGITVVLHIMLSMFWSNLVKIGSTVRVIGL